MKNDDIIRELKQRGTAEVVNGEVVQATQAIDETGESVKYLMFGELREQGIIPIGEACAKCGHCRFDTIKECQEFQGKDARARGFTQVICPSQFI